MGYYRGDHYRGDYYRGDPSFLSGLGSLVKKAAGAALSFLPGGGVAKTALQVFKGVTPANRADIETGLISNQGSPLSAINTFLPSIVPTVTPPFKQALVTQSPLGTPVTQAAIQRQLMGMGGMRGMHVNRSTYVTRGGGTSHYPPGLQLHPKGTTQVTNRRMNWGNGRALARAEKRIAAFLHHATKYMKWAHPHKAGGHAVPKFPKRRKK